MERQCYKYLTQQGDTFDSIALEFYGEEKYSIFIIQLNPKYIDTIIFDYGVSLIIPDINIKNTSTLPPWKK
ncbi:tail protein X [Clostridium beijerinckii]|uniref:Phage tail protein X n=1 Tax=Clostridium beijerinckii TaxID=1520 RepID=A0AAX0B4L1_CLOBE|nr:tail protein X [Clostridium beijerinckii]NRT90091.1 phage tail protein X [Clostridium beijerinckii]NYC69621.1 phage tail protein X [Clostridium beijerinckii]